MKLHGIVREELSEVHLKGHSLHRSYSRSSVWKGQLASSSGNIQGCFKPAAVLHRTEGESSPELTLAGMCMTLYSKSIGRGLHGGRLHLRICQKEIVLKILLKVALQE